LLGMKSVICEYDSLLLQSELRRHTRLRFSVMHDLKVYDL